MKMSCLPFYFLCNSFQSAALTSNIGCWCVTFKIAYMPLLFLAINYFALYPSCVTGLQTSKRVNRIGKIICNPSHAHRKSIDFYLLFGKYLHKNGWWRWEDTISTPCRLWWWCCVTAATSCNELVVCHTHIHCIYGKQHYNFWIMAIIAVHNSNMQIACKKAQHTSNANAYVICTQRSCSPIICIIFH